MRALVLALALAVPAARAELATVPPPFSDGWRFTDKSSKWQPFFSEFKYFNFQDTEHANLSGVMTYAVISPGFLRKLKINAYFHQDGKIWTLQKTYPLSCVAASGTHLKADLCGEGSIDTVFWGPEAARVRVKQDTGPLRWDLTFTAPMEQVTAVFSRIPFTGDFFSRYMDWSPVFRSGQVDGEVFFADEGRRLRIDTETSYHDQNYQVWNPKAQPFNWFHFTGKDSAGRRVDLTLVEFPNNGRVGPGLKLFTGGVERTWAPGTYELIPVSEGMISVDRRYGDDADGLRRILVHPTFGIGHRRIVTRYRVTTADGQLEAELDAVAAISTSGSEPGTREESLVDEQLVRTRIRFLAPEGDVRTAEGPGEFMNTATGP